jgi:hypothetical protein
MSWFGPLLPGAGQQQAAGGAANVTPGKATVTITAFAPTVTVSNNVVVTPGKSTVTITSFAPTVLTPRTVTPGTATATITAFAPTVTTSNNIVITPGKATVTITAFAPTVTTSNNIVITPGKATVGITSFAPAVDISTGDVPIIIIGGDDAPRRRRKKRKEPEHEDLFKQIERTIHALLHPDEERRDQAASGPVAELQPSQSTAAALEAEYAALLGLAEESHQSLQALGRIRREIDQYIARQNEEEEEASLMMFL